MALDHYNGQSVLETIGGTQDDATFKLEGGAVIHVDCTGIEPASLIGTKLLKVDEQEGSPAVLEFGHPRPGQASLVIAVAPGWEVTGGDLSGGNADG